MRYRQLDAAGDYMPGAFLANSPEAVAQAIMTRLRLWVGEWFINTADGTPWMQQILGKRAPSKNPDAAIKQRILGTPGVQEITAYSSSFDGNTRTVTITATIATIYGAAQISETL